MVSEDTVDMGSPAATGQAAPAAPQALEVNPTTLPNGVGKPATGSVSPTAPSLGSATSAGPLQTYTPTPKPSTGSAVPTAPTSSTPSYNSAKAGGSTPVASSGMFKSIEL